MGCDLHIVKMSDIVRLDANGRFNLEQTRNVLASIARTCLDRGINAALLDVRDAHGDLSMTDMYTLASAFHDMGFKQEHRLAVLHPFHGERAEFFALCASQR